MKESSDIFVFKKEGIAPQRVAPVIDMIKGMLEKNAIEIPDLSAIPDTTNTAAINASHEAEIAQELLRRAEELKQSIANGTSGSFIKRDTMFLVLWKKANEIQASK